MAGTHMDSPTHIYKQALHLAAAACAEHAQTRRRRSLQNSQSACSAGPRPWRPPPWSPAACTRLIRPGAAVEWAFHLCYNQNGVHLSDTMPVTPRYRTTPYTPLYRRAGTPRCPLVHHVRPCQQRNGIQRPACQRENVGRVQPLSMQRDYKSRTDLAATSRSQVSRIVLRCEICPGAEIMAINKRARCLLSSPDMALCCR